MDDKAWAAIFAGAASVLTVIFVKGGPYIKTLLTIKSKKDSIAHELASKGQEAVIALLSDQVESLRAEVAEVRQEAKDAEKECHERFERLERESREERHAMRNAEHKCMLEQARLQAELDILKRQIKGQEQ